MPKFSKAPLALTAALALACFACSPSTANHPNEATQHQNTAEAPTLSPTIAECASELVPFEDVQAPQITKIEKVRMSTEVGDLLIEVYPAAAPNAAARFIELVEKGFYDNTPIFRVVNGFVAQFGVNSRPGMVEYKDKNFNDDPSYYKLLPGTLAFAKAGPNTNSTQVFINFNDNSPLRDQGFTTFARIVEGYENCAKFKMVGDPSMGLDQEMLWGNTDAYLMTLRDKPVMITKAVVVKDEAKGEDKGEAAPAK